MKTMIEDMEVQNMEDVVCAMYEIERANGWNGNGLPVDFRDGKDSHGDYFIVIDSTEDMNKFVEYVGKLLDMDKDEMWDIERILHCNIVYSDEWSFCDNCYKVVRTSPTHYGWIPDYWLDDNGFLTCNACFHEDADIQESYLETLINDPTRANILLSEVDLEVDWEFERYNGHSYENGFHHGQTDDPRKIFAHLSQKYDEVVFSIDSVGQFDTHFSVFVKGEKDKGDE